MPGLLIINLKTIATISWKVIYWKPWLLNRCNMRRTGHALCVSAGIWDINTTFSERTLTNLPGFKSKGTLLIPQICIFSIRRGGSEVQSTSCSCRVQFPASKFGGSHAQSSSRKFNALFCHLQHLHSRTHASSEIKGKIHFTLKPAVYRQWFYGKSKVTGDFPSMRDSFQGREGIWLLLPTQGINYGLEKMAAKYHSKFLILEF